MNTIDQIAEAVGKMTPGKWSDVDGDIWWNENRDHGEISEANAVAIVALRNHAETLLECARLLREARDSVEYEAQDLEESYGERLMHKQEPVRELLKRIDAALARLGEKSSE
jgi:hypothetical protein